MGEGGGLNRQRFHVLLALVDRDLHGTAIMEEVLARTDGALKLWPGTLYGTLRALETEGLVRDVEPPVDAPTEGGKRRFYTLTREGRRVLEREVVRLEALVRHARAKRGLRGPEPA